MSETEFIAKSDAELECTEEGRKILRFRQTGRRAKVLGWMILVLALYQFAFGPAVAWMDPTYADFAKAMGPSWVGIFIALCAWHCSLLGIDRLQGREVKAWTR